jgi:FAD/FMN-containing dehydrogenase
MMAETNGMNHVLEIDKEKLAVTVQTGITLWEFNDIRVIPG